MEDPADKNSFNEGKNVTSNLGTQHITIGILLSIAISFF